MLMRPYTKYNTQTFPEIVSEKSKQASPKERVEC